MSSRTLIDNRFEEMDEPEETLKKDIEEAFEKFRNGEISRPAFGELLDGLTAEYYHYTRYTERTADEEQVTNR